MRPPAEQANSIERHERYLAADPNNVLLRRALGDLYHRSGQFDKALECYGKCLEQNPADTGAQSRAAAVYISQHRFAEAEEALRALIDRGEQDPALFNNLGLALYYQERWGDSAEALQKARDGGVNDPDNLRHLAFALHGVGKMEEAIAMCDAWLALAPSSHAAGYRSLLQMESGDIAAAAKSAREVVAAEPENPDANLVLGMWATERLEMDDAAARFERLTRAEPDNVRAWSGLALVQLYRQDHDAAIASFNRVLKLQPDNVGIIVALGWAHFTKNEIPTAEATFRRAILIDHTFGEAHGGLATTLVWQNRRDEARREVALARRLDPKGFGMVYARSVLMALEGRREQGEHLLAQNLERTLRPDGRSIMDSIRIFLRSKTSGPPRPPRLTVKRQIRR